MMFSIMHQHIFIWSSLIFCCVLRRCQIYRKLFFVLVGDCCEPAIPSSKLFVLSTHWWHGPCILYLHFFESTSKKSRNQCRLRSSFICRLTCFDSKKQSCRLSGFIYQAILLDKISQNLKRASPYKFCSNSLAQFHKTRIKK